MYEEFMRLASERYSVRKFDGRALEAEIIEKILRAGQLSPTACNRQPQRIAVITSPEGLEKLRRCTECHFNAPAALLVCHDKEECWKRSYDGASSGDIDAAIVTTHMMLAAWALGVGTTWVMHFIPEAVRAVQRRAFDELGLEALWCGWYDGNDRSRRVQEKCGFRYHHIEYDKPTLLGDRRTEHFSRLTRAEWEASNNGTALAER